MTGLLPVDNVENLLNEIRSLNLRKIPSPLCLFKKELVQEWHRPQSGRVYIIPGDLHVIRVFQKKGLGRAGGIAESPRPLDGRFTLIVGCPGSCLVGSGEVAAGSAATTEDTIKLTETVLISLGP